MIVGFVGTRHGPTPQQHDAMRRFLAGIPMTRFVHGCDALAHYIVERFHPGVVIELHPSTDRRSYLLHNPTGNLEIYPELPPLQRNRVIVHHVHGLLAVPRTDMEYVGSGTWATVRYAREIGLPIYLVRQNGRIVRDAELGL